MDQRARMIEEQMNAARARLVEKLDALERRADRKFAQPVHEAFATLDSVRHSFADATAFVRGIPDRARERPWLMLGVSVAAGYGACRLLDKRLRARIDEAGRLQVAPEARSQPASAYRPEPRAEPTVSPSPRPEPAEHPSVSRASQAPARAPASDGRGNGKSEGKSKSGGAASETFDKIKHQVADVLEEPIEELKGVAVDAARGLAWGLLSKALPDIFRAEHLGKVAPRVKPPSEPEHASAGKER